MGGAGAREIKHRGAIDGGRRGPRHVIQRLNRWAAQGPETWDTGTLQIGGAGARGMRHRGARSGRRGSHVLGPCSHRPSIAPLYPMSRAPAPCVSSASVSHNAGPCAAHL